MENFEEHRHSPWRRLWSWLAGTSLVPVRERRKANAHAPIPADQLAALTSALDAERARACLPNLLVVEQTLCMSLGPELAAVPDFVLAKALGELRSLAAFADSAALQAFHRAACRQVACNEQAQALVMARAGRPMPGRGAWALGTAVAMWVEADEEAQPPSPEERAADEGEDFQDTEPMGQQAFDGEAVGRLPMPVIGRVWM